MSWVYWSLNIFVLPSVSILNSYDSLKKVKINLFFNHRNLLLNLNDTDELSATSSVCLYPVSCSGGSSPRSLHLTILRLFLLLSRSAIAALKARSTKYELVKAIKKNLTRSKK